MRLAAGFRPKTRQLTRMYYGSADSCLAVADVLCYRRKCPAPATPKRTSMVLND